MLFQPSSDIAVTCSFLPVDKCLNVIASFKPTSSDFLKLVVDFLRRGVILSSIKCKNAGSILVKFL